MDIVIIGGGKVGFTLAEQLSKENHNITVIDTDTPVLGRIVEVLDVIGIYGNGASYQVQKEAGMDKADLMIAVTSSDELNMICCLLAHKLGAAHTIARIRNPEYWEQLNILKKELGLSMAINPERAAAMEIARLISFPYAISTSSFARGRVSVVEMRIASESHLAHCAVHDIHRRFFEGILICAVDRGGELFIPRGDFILRPEDKIYVSGNHEKIAFFLRRIDIRSIKVKDMMMIGGSRIAFYLGQLMESMDISVRIIERQRARCEFLSQALPTALIIEGDGTAQDLLSEEGLTDMDALVALTDIDEENLIISMYAAKIGVSKTIAKINRLDYLDILEASGIDSVVSPKYITAYQILQYVRAIGNAEGSRVRALYRIAGGKAEIVEFHAGPHTRHLGQKLVDIDFKDNTLIGAIVREGNLIIPHGQDVILDGDSVIAVTAHAGFDDINDLFR